MLEIELFFRCVLQQFFLNFLRINYKQEDYQTVFDWMTNLVKFFDGNENILEVKEAKASCVLILVIFKIQYKPVV